MNFRRTRAMARKEFIHVIRDPRSLISALMQPLIMLLIFGWALSLDVDRVPTFIYDLDRTSESRALIREFRGSRYFQIVEETQSYQPIQQGMDTRRCLLGVVIPANYSRNLDLGKDAQVQLLVDGSDSNTASIAKGYAEGVVQAFSQRVREGAQSTRAGSVLHAGINTQVRVWYNPDLLSQFFIVPGLVVVILAIVAANLSSLTIAREWENGTMEQLLSTPVRPVEMALGKMSAYFAVGLLDMAICLAVGVFAFGVPIKGSFVLLMAASCVFLFGAIAFGIFISASNRTQLTAYQMGTLTSFLPAFLLSGFIYSIGNMPRVIQAIALFVPARYFINIVRGIFLKGIGLEILWSDSLLLVGYAVMVFYFATRKLRQKVA
jgi:ABC-2 type transport system permease protein